MLWCINSGLASLDLVHLVLLDSVGKNHSPNDEAEYALGSKLCC